MGMTSGEFDKIKSKNRDYIHVTYNLFIYLFIYLFIP